MLCDAATVREGLLHVLGGGVDRLGRASFPAPMDLVLAVVIQQHPTELDREHNMRVLIQHADGKRLAEAEITWQATSERPRLHEMPFPVVLPLRHVNIPAPSEYSIELLIDGVHQTSIPFTVADSLADDTTPRLG